jgi:hypothetical protein
MGWLVNTTPTLPSGMTHFVGSWVSPRAGLDDTDSFALHRYSIPGPSSPWRFAVQLPLAWLEVWWCKVTLALHCKFRGNPACHINRGNKLTLNVSFWGGTFLTAGFQNTLKFYGAVKVCPAVTFFTWTLLCICDWKDEDELDFCFGEYRSLTDIAIPQSFYPLHSSCEFNSCHYVGERGFAYFTN